MWYLCSCIMSNLASKWYYRLWPKLTDVDQDTKNHKQSEDLMDIVPNHYRQFNVFPKLPIAICGNGEHVFRRNFTHLQLFLLYGVSDKGCRSEQKQVLDTFRRLWPPCVGYVLFDLCLQHHGEEYVRKFSVPWL